MLDTSIIIAYAQQELNAFNAVGNRPRVLEDPWVHVIVWCGVVEAS